MSSYENLNATPGSSDKETYLLYFSDSLDSSPVAQFKNTSFSRLVELAKYIPYIRVDNVPNRKTVFGQRHHSSDSNESSSYVFRYG